MVSVDHAAPWKRVACLARVVKGRKKAEIQSKTTALPCIGKVSGVFIEKHSGSRLCSSSLLFWSWPLFNIALKGILFHRNEQSPTQRLIDSVSFGRGYRNSVGESPENSDLASNLEGPVGFNLPHTDESPNSLFHSSIPRMISSIAL
jgi:hypothetical protein